jgi:hypothetical protein
MANRTDADAATIKGTNPQNLVEKIIRSKIYECMFWKQYCFALNAETIVDQTMELKAVGGKDYLLPSPESVEVPCSAYTPCSPFHVTKACIRCSS